MSFPHPKIPSNMIQSIINVINQPNTKYQLSYMSLQAGTEEQSTVQPVPPPPQHEISNNAGGEDTLKQNPELIDEQHIVGGKQDIPQIKVQEEVMNIDQQNLKQNENKIYEPHTEQQINETAVESTPVVPQPQPEPQQQKTTQNPVNEPSNENPSSEPNANNQQENLQKDQMEQVKKEQVATVGLIGQQGEKKVEVVKSEGKGASVEGEGEVKQKIVQAQENISNIINKEKVEVTIKVQQKIVQKIENPQIQILPQNSVSQLPQKVQKLPQNQKQSTPTLQTSQNIQKVNTQQTTQPISKQNQSSSRSPELKKKKSCLLI